MLLATHLQEFFKYYTNLRPFPKEATSAIEYTFLAFLRETISVCVYKAWILSGI